MAKPEWGTKQTCPKCGERFYDLTKDDPVTCIACGNEWVPEPILKAKQPIIVAADEKKDDDEIDDTLEDDDADDDSVADISLDDDDDEEVSAMVDTKLTEDDS